MKRGNVPDLDGIITHAMVVLVVVLDIAAAACLIMGIISIVREVIT